MKVKLSRATFTDVTVEIPRECPACRSDLTEPGGVVEWNWVDEGVCSTIREEPGTDAVEIESDGHTTNAAHSYHADEVRCTTCDAIVAPVPVVRCTPKCRGWLVIDGCDRGGTEIQRCDDCREFSTDEAAAMAALAWAMSPGAAADDAPIAIRAAALTLTRAYPED